MNKKNVEAIYPLSLQQQGMLFETLCAPESGIHFEQSTWIMHGNLNISAFEQAWQRVVNRHSILRTGFVWKDQDDPLQVVLQQVEISLEYQDWRGVTSSEQQEQLQAYINTARRRSFELSKPPLMRPALFQIAEDTYQIVWTSLHILMDAWCKFIVYKELIDFYQAFSKGKKLHLEPSRPYKAYVTWLQQQDLSKAETFWRRRLQGFTKPTPLGLMVAPHSFSAQEERYNEQSICLSEPDTAALQSLARQHHLTLNTLVQGVWALLLSHYSGEEDVVFGITVSGRPPQLAGSESMIGLFINTLPLRVKVLPKTPFWSWLKNIQVHNIELRQYEYSSSGQIHQWSEVPGALPLHESILVFENYPVDASALQPSDLNISIDRRHTSFEGTPTKYLLTLIVFPDSKLRFQLIYDRRRLNRSGAVQILEHLLALLKSILSEPKTELLTLLNKIPSDQIPKVRSLQAFAQQGLEKAFVAPRTPIEKVLAGIWAQVLGLEQVSIEDNFFELGGHSLLATQLMVKVREAFQVNLPMRCLFEASTLTNFAVELAKYKVLQTEDSEPVTQLPTIVPAPSQRHQPFPLNEMQQAYWIGRNNFFELGNVAIHAYMEIESADLDLERFNLAWQRLVERHDMLRVIVHSDGQQQILEQVPPYQIKLLDLRGKGSNAIASELEVIRDRLSHQVLPLDQWPLFEICATRIDDQYFRLHISVDGLCVDGWSVQILLQDLVKLYQAPNVTLTPLELSFRDYVLAEIALKESPVFKRSLEYWQSRLSTLPPAPDLPQVLNPSSLTQPRFRRWNIKLEREVWQPLKHRAAQMNLTPTGILLAAYAEVLTVWSKSPRFTINVPRFNRLPLHPQVNDIIGEFASFTLLEVDNSEQDPFTVRARRLQEKLWKDLENQYVSGVRVLRELSKAQGRTSGAVMPIVFTTTPQNVGSRKDSSIVSLFKQLGNLVYDISQTPQVWLDCQFIEEEDSLFLFWDGVEELFPVGLVDDMFDAYCRLLKRLASEEEAWQEKTRQLVPLAQLERRAEVNATAVPMPEELVHTLFAVQVAQRPQQAAAIAPNRTLTYEDLYRRSNQIGHRLRKLGAVPNTLVAIVMEKGWEQVVGVLGVLASGAAYLPIAPELPKERLWYLLADGEVQLVLTQSWLRDRLEWPEGIQCLCLDNEELAGENDQPLEPAQRPDDLAYVIYTSGSTGLPKGVMIAHRSVVNLVVHTNKSFNVNSKDRVLALTALNHDLSVYDIFGLLAAGGTIVIPEASGMRDPAHWVALMQKERVTVWNSVPAMMEMLLEYAADRSKVLLPDLRLAILGGDWLSITLPKRLKALTKGVQVLSIGGPTETTVWNIWYPVETVDSDCKSIPYGKPIANTKYYVFNEALEDCPVWVPGELYCAGIGLAKGYWRNEEKSRANFINHPVTGDRLYKTGDLGRYLPDGNIEFLGRADFQLKIRGYRIEPGEIEAALVQHLGVQASVVKAVGEQRGKERLVAYVVSHQEQVPTLNELRGFLKEKLPEYMIPSAFIWLDALPLSPNGKIDRQALPDPDTVMPKQEKTFVAPRTPLEEVMVGIWAEILGVEQVGIHDNFFFDLGGNSLLATQVMTHVRETLHIEIPLRHFFEAPTVAEQVAVILQTSAERFKIEATAQLLLSVAELSDDEVEKMLAERKGLRCKP